MRHGIAWAGTVVGRLTWGAQEVGVAQTLSGLWRLIVLAVQRPPRAEVVTIGSGFRFAFAYPGQLMPLLVTFRELVEPELRLLTTLLGPGRVAVDVGASIGTWTMCAARTGAAVHACEPDPVNLRSLNENVRGNGFADSVTVHSLAIGAREGWSVVSEGARRYLTRCQIAESKDRSSGIEMLSLDEFVRTEGLARIDVLKVNTAGGEDEVLAGAIETFRKERVGVAVFLDGPRLRAVLDTLRAFRYDIGFFDGRKGRFVPVDRTSALDRLRPGPMNRYIVVKHSAVSI